MDLAMKAFSLQSRAALGALALIAAASLCSRAADFNPLAGLPPASEAPRLIATLQQADASEAAKARACQNLALLGGPDAVPASRPTPARRSR
jgi:hypothetical protein